MKKTKRKVIRDSHNIIHYIIVVLFSLIKSLFFAALWTLIGLGGYFIFKVAPSPINIALGFPLALIGGGLTVQVLADIFLRVLSWEYNKGVCFLCNTV